MNLDFLNVLVQTGLLLAAYVTIFMGVFGNWKKKQSDALAGLKMEHDKEIAELKEEQTRSLDHLAMHHKEDIADLRVQLANERADRVEKTSRLHTRVDEMQKELIGNLRSDMSEIKGRLVSIDNITRIFQEWFVNQNKINGE